MTQTKQLQIKNRSIGDGNPAYLIAEMSANHAGDMGRALEIIHAAKESGADCIKIQTYTPDTITLNCNNEFFTLSGGTWKGENLYELYGKAYTPWEWQGRLKEEADKIGIDFFSTPFDKTAVDFLEELKVDFYKIASFEVVDIPLLKAVAATQKPIVMSVGMATTEEIEEAMKAIYSQGNTQLAILKCSSVYPAIPDTMNLKTLQDMKERFGVPVGLSDHSMGNIAAVTAVALGANIIEKHFCLSRDIENPDVSFSMEPEEFAEMVKNIRLAEKAMGKVSYELSAAEKESRNTRKSIFVSADIKKGEVLTPENIRVVRPAYGMEPKYYEMVLGKKVKEDLKFGTPLSFDVIE
ncbi:MAG: pseudaminic acid synthase [Lachnospiraceae bacterium]|nr:pseudaminic acid synthase [Lachnospiraceae bacterium]